MADNDESTQDNSTTEFNSRTSQLSSRSNESVELAEIIKTRQQKIESLGHLSEMMESKIKYGIELSSKK